MCFRFLCMLKTFASLWHWIGASPSTQHTTHTTHSGLSKQPIISLIKAAGDTGPAHPMSPSLSPARGPAAARTALRRNNSRKTHGGGDLGETAMPRGSGHLCPAPGPVIWATWWFESSPQGGFATPKAPEAARAWERPLAHPG